MDKKSIPNISLFYGLLLLLMSGCATAPYITKPQSALRVPGIYHRVEKGQTLWRISKLYNIDLDELITANHVSDSANIEIGQLLFVPHRYKQQSLPQKAAATEDFIWPLRGNIIVNFGQIFYDMINKGINIRGNRNSDVLAARSGRVIFYDDNFNDFGKTIIIEHNDGFSTVYSRNSQVFIKVGDYVQRGSVIAKAGSSKRDPNTYLHFEIRKGPVAQNPLFYLP